MKKFTFFLLGFLFAQLSFGQTIIARQDFEVEPASPAMTYAATTIGTGTGGISSGVSPAGGRPVGSNLFSAGTQGYRVTGGTGTPIAGQTLTFSAVNTSGYENIKVSYRVAAFSVGTVNGGMDTANEQVLLEVSPDGGTNWYQQSRVNIISFNNAAWDFTGAAGIGTRAYLANNSVTTHSTTPTATPQTVTGSAAITTVIVTNLPAVNNLQVRITPQSNSAAEVWYIDDVIITGTVVTSDTTPPLVSTFSPLDDATGASITGDLSINFNENVAKGTGNILIKKTLDNSIFETIDVTTAAISVSGATVTINPAGTFDNLAGYYVEIPAGAIKDSAGNDYAGISSATAWNFTTIGISSITLADNSTQVAAAVAAQGATAHVLHKFSLAVATTNTSLTGVQVTTAGTYTTADLTNLKVRYSTDATLNASDATLSTYTSVPTAGTLTFPSFVSQAINAGSTGYIFITADVTESATLGNTISIDAVTTAQLTFSGGIKSGSTAAGGAQAVVAKIITFDFAGLPGSPTVTVTANSNFNNANLTASTISRGAGLTNPGNADRFNSQNWALTDIATAIANDDYVEFTITPNAGYQFRVSSIVFNIMRSATSFTGIALRSSVDGYTTNLDAEKAIADITDVTEIIRFTFSQANSSTPVTYRLYGWAESIGGSGGFEGTGNDIIVTGTTESTFTTWNGSAWSNGTPTASLDAIIDGAYLTKPVIDGGNGTFSAKKITITATGSLTINSLTNVTVQNEVINNGTLAVENNANLIQTNNVANTGSGTTTVNRNGSILKRLDYTLWSSPVAPNQTLKGFSGLTVDPRFYEYLESSNKYSAVNPAATTFATGKGYLIRMPDQYPANSGNGTAYYAGQGINSALAYPGAFNGVLNNGNIPVTLTKSEGVNKGYVAVGNPYPSVIDAQKFVTANTANIENTLYFWRKTNGTTEGSAYATWTAAGGTIPTAGTPSSETPNGKIQVGQGFFVRAKNAGTVSVANFFTNAMRDEAPSSQQFFKLKQQAQKDRVWLNLTTTTGVFSQALVAYLDDATLGLDQYDGKYINDSDIALSTSINNEEYTIQGRPAFDAADAVALNFKTSVAGTYNIAIDHADGLFSKGQGIYLVDKTTGITSNLNEGAYTFTANAGVDNARFTLTYQKTLKIDAPLFNENSVLVSRNNGTISVNSKAVAINNIKVYDVQGRLVAERKNVKSNTATFSNFKTNQVFIIEVTSEDNNVVIKKVLN